MVLHGVEFAHTHDIEYLVTHVQEAGVEPPLALRDAEWLTPWAAQLRYDEPPSVLDRTEALAAAAVTWASSLVPD